MRITGQPSKLIAGLLSLVALPALTAPVTSAATQTPKQVKTSVKLSSHVLKLGGTVRLQLQVDGTRDAQLLELPAVDGLEFGRGPRKPDLVTPVVDRLGRETLRGYRVPVLGGPPFTGHCRSLRRPPMGRPQHYPFCMNDGKTRPVSGSSGTGPGLSPS